MSTASNLSVHTEWTASLTPTAACCTCRAWSPCGALIAVALARPRPGSAQLLVLNTSLELVHTAFTRAVQLAWGASSCLLACLYKEMYVETELLMLGLLKLGPLDAGGGSWAQPPIVRQLALGEASSAGQVLGYGVSSCTRRVEFSQGGAFLALATTSLLLAWPSWPGVRVVPEKHALHAAWVPSLAGQPERLLLHARQPMGTYLLHLYTAPPGALHPQLTLGPPVAVLPNCLPGYQPSLALHPSGRFVALPSPQHSWHVCCLSTGEVCSRGPGPREAVVQALHWSSWGEVLYVHWSVGAVTEVRFGPPERELAAVGRALASARIA